MCNSLFILILIFIFCGCATNSHFIEYRNYDIGRNVDESFTPSPRKKSFHNPIQDKYLYESENGCQWVYYVNKETRIIESWAYVSSPDKCTLGYNWWGPW